MKHEVFLLGMERLRVVFNAEASKTLIDAYWSVLSGLSDEQFAAATQKIIGENKFFPRPSEIREAAEDVRPPRPELPEWQKLRSDPSLAWCSFHDEGREPGQRREEPEWWCYECQRIQGKISGKRPDGLLDIVADLADSKAAP